MPRALAFSPHLDDAAFSCGGTLARLARMGWEITLCTAFTQSVPRPTGFALACQLDKGLGPEVDYMALRRAEDAAACAELGASAVHLPFLEAPHRGYEDAKALFRDRLADDHIVQPLRAALIEVVETERPDLILGPLCLGDHVDHHVVHEALQGLGPLLLWEDWPYADRPEVTRPSGAALTVPLDDRARARRTAACAAYRSQLGFQFGGEAAMAARVAAIAEERFHAPQA
jgi:LmbE family N-acetylglucosaminyl deacetylase